MKYIALLIALGVLSVVGLVVLLAATYTLDETEQAIVLQFGDPVGQPVMEPGLHWKAPFIQEVRRFDKRLLAWDGDPNQIPTAGREYISVDATARWRIVDPLTFLQSVTNEAGAQSRLDDVIDSEVRNNIAGSDLVEIVRSADWEVTEEQLEQVEVPVDQGEKELTKEVQRGRKQLTREILKDARAQMPQYGIELVDVRLKRLNYIADVREQVFNRMISERQRVAERFRSEGQGEASSIRGDTSHELAEIRSEARREAEVIRGEADAEATRIYNEAYGREPEFYRFYRTLESYGKTMDDKAVLMIGMDSDYFRYLKRIEPDEATQVRDGQ
ncbi:MAG: protease modulator HflC [Phycisphaeraceae bacterium]